MITLKIDGVARGVPERTRLEKLAPQGALVAKLNDGLVDLAYRVAGSDDGADVSFLTSEDPDGLRVMRHSAAHVMAQAVLRIFPEAQYAIGPATDDGFFYDFELPRTLTPDDLPEIERHMADIVAADQRFVRDEVPRSEALELFTDFDQPFKREILEGTDEAGEVKVGEVVSLYRNGDAYVDLCVGPHVPSTKRIGAFKLLAVSGAHWRGRDDRPMLQRVKGTAWPDAKALEQYLHRMEEAERRDHRVLGRELDLFSSPPELGAGLFVWHPKGGLVRKIIEDYSRDEHLKRGYDIVATPHIGRSVLWETSGHLEKFAENMFPAVTAEEGDYYLKPMNCPFHILIYKSRTRSYRDLPLRYSELGTVYRHELSGVLHGLIRVRGFTQDDAHIFCRRDQVVEEILGVMDMTVAFYEAFGMADPTVDLSTKPAKTIGSPEMWAEAETILREALERSPFEYEEAKGEGAFYGPKIDFHFKDSIGRSTQLTTIQIDFGLPERFGLEYVGSDNQPHRPIMIHRALFGSEDRFLAILLEHYAGALPPWLAPVHARIIPLNDKIAEQAAGVADDLRARGLRADVDRASESVNYKIRRGTLEKVPWMIVIGPKELEAGTLSVRTRNGTDRRGVPIEEFVAEALDKIASRATDAE